MPYRGKSNTPDFRAKKTEAKKEFVRRVLKEDAEYIRKQQQKVVAEWGLFDEGDLEQSLKGHFSVDSTDETKQLTMRYLVYARFLDMADPRRRTKREGYHLYNRIVFGVIYNRTLAKLQNGYTEEVRNKITADLENAKPQYNG